MIICGIPFSGRSTLLRLIRKLDVTKLLSDHTVDSSSSGFLSLATSLVSSAFVPSTNSTDSFTYKKAVQFAILASCLNAMQLILQEIKTIPQEDDPFSAYNSEDKKSVSKWTEYDELINTYEEQVNCVNGIHTTINAPITTWDRILDQAPQIVNAIEDLWRVPVVKLAYQKLMQSSFFTPYTSNNHTTHIFKESNVKGENIHELFDNLHIIMKSNYNFSDSLHSNSKILQLVYSSYLLDNTFHDWKSSLGSDEKSNPNVIVENSPSVTKFGKRRWCVKMMNAQMNYTWSSLEFQDKPNLAPIVVYLISLADIDRYRKNTPIFDSHVKYFTSLLSAPGTQKVLLFTKVDIFANKIMSGKVKVSEIFPNFVGNDRDPLRVFEYIFNKFWIPCRKYHENVPYYVVNLVDLEECSQFLSILLEKGSPYMGRSFISRHLLRMMEIYLKNNLKNSYVQGSTCSHGANRKGQFSDIEIVISESENY
ncbi:hypothetical protein FDP41_012944 [Naegleria fowleri]|uniref:G domain-containing protein n=2 Tax=Naegleria fowleri TaxID=5763 RepID=A0A6A5C0D5_NAEFO|nr:uncharacterized protein FDP41_012944 [Naegleria fowleri]KAF0981156.1 hypothetical protein FDP41_012944 [Naegleria fowleri]